MPDQTQALRLPYPLEDERPDVPSDMKALAEAVDAALTQHFAGTGPPPSVGDTLPDGTHVAVLRHGDVYYLYKN